MSRLSEHNERWRWLAEAELLRIDSDVPAEFVLAVWYSESRGGVDIHNEESGASGLGQVMQVGLDFYNERHATSIALADLRERTDRSWVLQARVSIWLLVWNVTQVERWLRDEPVEPADLWLLSLLSYHQGWGRVRSRLRGLQQRGLPPTWANMERYYPTGWKAKANVFRYNEGTFQTFNRLLQGDGDAAVGGPGQPTELPEPPSEEVPALIEHGSTIGLIGVGLAVLGLVLAVITLVVRRSE